MRTPQQAMKDAIESGAVQAWIDGKKIQVRCALDTSDEWFDFRGPNPGWMLDHSVWRPAPEPKLRPWKPEEVPVGALLRLRGKTTIHSWLITGYSSDTNMIAFGLRGEIGVESLEEYEHSTDNGKTWAPCGVMEGVE